MCKGAMYITNGHIDPEILVLTFRIKDIYLLLGTDGVNLKVELLDGASRAIGYKTIATPSGSINFTHDESHSCLLQPVHIIRGPVVES